MTIYKHTTINGFVSLILFVQAIYLFLPQIAHCQFDKKEILVLNSYHPGYSWSDEIVKGIRSVFSEDGDGVAFYIEYMDTKRLSPEISFPLLEQLYQIKYKQPHFDVIIVSDNNALKFLKENHDKLFPNIPIVFCGINNYRDDLIAGIGGVTGVAEDIDFSETVRLVLKLHPEATHLVAISDGTVSANENLLRFQEGVSGVGEKIQTIELTALPPQDLAVALEKLPPTSILFHLDYYAPPKSSRLSVKESFALINTASSLPIYVNTDNKIGMGAVGGVVNTGYLQGQTAAGMAKDILSGTPVSEIPIQKVSPKRTIFDYKLLKRYKINFSKLPENSIFINQPQSFYAKYKAVIAVVSGIILVLTFFSVCLTIVYLKQRRSEKKYRSLFDDALEMIHIVNKDGLIIDANLTELQTLGYNAEEYIGKPVLDIIHPDYKEKTMVALRCLAEGKDVKEFESMFICKNGAPVHVEVNSVPEIKDGKLVSARAIIRNITSRKELEERLVQAQKMEAIGTLAGGIAHDFNNILTAILGYTELALGEIDNPEKLKKHLDEVFKGGNRAKELVQQILAFSRKSAKQLEPLRVQIIVKEVLKLLRSSIPATIEIKQNIDSDCDIVLADPTQIHQVIMNLCTNAYQAMRETGGILTISLQAIHFSKKDVSTEMHLEPGSYLKLDIGDTGVGIPKEFKDRIFEPYFSTKEKGEGTGLGLAVVHGIVTNLKGEITVFSEPERGTTFTVYLPTAEAEEKIDPEENLTTSFPTGSGHILLVDDDEVIVNLNKTLLEKIDYKVTALTSSVEALVLFQKDQDSFDLVITDMTMPKMTGKELAQQLLAIRPNLPIILCSGHSDLIDQQDAKAMGIRAYVMKPCSNKDFVMTVRKVLDDS